MFLGRRQGSIGSTATPEQEQTAMSSSSRVPTRRATFQDGPDMRPYFRTSAFQGGVAAARTYWPLCVAQPSMEGPLLLHAELTAFGSEGIL